MTAPQFVTSITATVPAERESELLAGYRRLEETAKPDGFVRSELLRGDDDRWSIQTLWRDIEALQAVRRAGKPPAALVLMESVGAVPESRDHWTVADSFGV